MVFNWHVLLYNGSIERSVLLCNPICLKNAGLRPALMPPGGSAYHTVPPVTVTALK